MPQPFSHRSRRGACIQLPPSCTWRDTSRSLRLRQTPHVQLWPPVLRVPVRCLPSCTCWSSFPLDDLLSTDAVDGIPYGASWARTVQRALALPSSARVTARTSVAATAAIDLV